MSILKSIIKKFIGVSIVTAIVALIFKLSIMYFVKEVSTKHFTHFTSAEVCTLEVSDKPIYQRIYDGCLQSNINKEKMKLSGEYIDYKYSEYQTTPFYNLTGDMAKREHLAAFRYLAALGMLPSYSKELTDKYDKENKLKLDKETYDKRQFDSKRHRSETFNSLSNKDSELNIAVLSDIDSLYSLLDKFIHPRLIALNSLLLIVSYYLFLVLKFKFSKGTKEINLDNVNKFDKSGGFFTEFILFTYALSSLALMFEKIM
jgi:hypothetical protein